MSDRSYDNSSYSQAYRREEKQKATPCIECPYCRWEDFGGLRIGFCLRDEAFIDEEFFESGTMWDCLKGEDQ